MNDSHKKLNNLRLMSTSMRVTHRNIHLSIFKKIYMDDLQKKLDCLQLMILTVLMTEENAWETFRMCWRHSEFVWDRMRDVSDIQKYQKDLYK